MSKNIRKKSIQGNKVALYTLFSVVMVLMSCAPTPTPNVTPQAVAIYASPAARPWLGLFYACADSSGVLLAESAPDEAQIMLRVGEPPKLTHPAYQVGTESLWLVVHPQNRVAPLSDGQILGLVSGQMDNWSAVGGADLPVQVWAYAPENDLMRVFDGTLLRGLPVTSTARLATGAEQLRREIAQDPGALGLLGTSGAQEDVRFLQKIADVPVLALAKDESLAWLIACAQGK